MPNEPNATDQTPASLLVRRVGPEAVGRGPELLPADLEGFASGGGLFVLADLVWEPSLDPLAVAALSLDRTARQARLHRVLVAAAHRRRGLGCRLLAGVAVVLRSDGIEVIDASDAPGDPARAFLRRVGFKEGEGAHLLYWL